MDQKQAAELYRGIETDRRLTRTERAAYKLIVSFHLGGKSFWGTNKYISETIAAGRYNVSHVITALVNKGFIIRKLVYSGKQVIKRILTPLIFSTEKPLYPYREKLKKTFLKPSIIKTEPQTKDDPAAEWKELITDAEKLGLNANYLYKHKAYGAVAIRQALDVLRHGRNVKNAYGYFKQAIKKAFKVNNTGAAHTVIHSNKGNIAAVQQQDLQTKLDILTQQSFKPDSIFLQFAPARLR